MSGVEEKTMSHIPTENASLTLILEAIDFHHTSGDEGNPEEIRLDVRAGPQLFEFDEDFNVSGTFFTVDHTFTFSSFNVNRDLIIRSDGFEDDPPTGEDQDDPRLPSDLTILQHQDLFDHSFTTTAENSAISYTLHWFLDVD
jgi:hypothetical protein